MDSSIRLVYKGQNEIDLATTEQALWQAFRQGDRAAFASIYQRYAPVLLSYGRKITANEQRIEDTIQDLFIELWQSRENLSLPTSIRFYLFRVLRNKLSRNRSNPPMSTIDTAELQGHEALLTQSLEDDWITQEETSGKQILLGQALSRLSQRQQEVIHLRYYQHLTSREISELMGINDQSIRNLLHTALRILKQSFIGTVIGLIISSFL